MQDPHFRQIKNFGIIAAFSGGLLMIGTLLIDLILLATIQDATKSDYFRGIEVTSAMIILSAALLGIGGDMQHAQRRAAMSREDLRFEWTGLLLILLAELAYGLWRFQPIATISALFILALLWIRNAVIIVTTR